MLSELNCIQKSFFHDSFPPNFGLLQIKFFLKLSLKIRIILLFILASQTRSIFSCKCCHEPSHLPIQLDVLSIMKNSAIACSFTLLICISESDKKSLIRHHHHQVPFFRRIIVLFDELLFIMIKAFKKRKELSKVFYNIFPILREREHLDYVAKANQEKFLRQARVQG